MLINKHIVLKTYYYLSLRSIVHTRPKKVFYRRLFELFPCPTRKGPLSVHVMKYTSLKLCLLSKLSILLMNGKYRIGIKPN